MLAKHFSQLGFNQNEIKIFIALIEQGRATAQYLSRHVGIPRTTAYSVLNNLLDKGVVALEQQGSTSYYTATSPESVIRIVEKEEEELAQKKLLAKELAESIAPYYQSRKIQIPKVQFFDGQKNVENMLYNSTPEWERSLNATDANIWGIQDHTFVEHYKTWLEWHWKRIPKKAPWMRITLFSNKSKVEKKLKGKVSNREIRPFPEEWQFDCTVWVMGEHLILIQSRKKPHYAFQLRDRAIAQNLRPVFRFLWGLTN